MYALVAVSLRKNGSMSLIRHRALGVGTYKTFVNTNSALVGLMPIYRDNRLSCDVRCHIC